MRQVGSTFKECLSVGLLVLVSLLVFARVVTYPILRWDDAMHILENPYLYLPMSLEKFARLWRFPYFGLYIPMTYTLWGSVKVWTAKPWAFHCLNLFFHLTNGILILSILKRLGLATGSAAIGVAFFLLHPLVVEPVTWISGLKDVGAMFFGLLGVTCALAGGWSSVARHGLTFLCYGLSVTTKPSGVIFPLLTGMLMLLSDKKWLDLRKNYEPILRPKESLLTSTQNHIPDPSRLCHRGLWHAAIGSLIVSPIVFFSMYLQPAVQMQEHVVWWKRPVIALDALAFYASKILLPLGLLPDYARRPSVVLAGDLFGSVAAGLLAVFLPWLFLRRHPTGLLGLAMVVVSLLPNLGLIPFAFQDHSTVADRYAYPAFFGVSLVMAWWARDLRWRLASLLPLAVLGILSYRQVGYWQDQVTLFRHVLEINPQSIVALDGLGVEDYRAGNMARAEDYFRRALAMNPRASRSWFNVGSVLWVKGDKIGATQALETSLKLDPNHPDTLNNLGFIYAATGKDQAAESLFRRALYVNHLDLDARYNLAQLLDKKGLLEESKNLLKEASAISPGFHDKYFQK